MKKITHNNRRGFTLVELLLYVALASVLLLALSVFLSLTFQTRIKSQSISNVEREGAFAMQVITQKVRNATGIISPATSTSAVSASLSFASSSLNPTVFDVQNGVLRIKEGAGAAVPLTSSSSRVYVSSVTFWNLSAAGTRGTLGVRFTVTHVNPAGRNEYDYAKTFYGSATIR